MFEHLQDEGKKKSLKLLSGTRWCSRSKAFEAIVETYQSVILFLSILNEEDRTECGATAAGQLVKIQSFKFLFLIMLVQKVFSITSILHEQLQAKNIDLKLVLDLGCATIIKLEELRSGFQVFFSLVETKALDCDIDSPSVPKNTRRNTAVKDFKQEYATMFETSIALYIKEIKLRFEPENLKPLISLYNIVNDSKLNVADIEQELAIYKDIIDFKCLKSELNLWYQLKEIRNLNSFEKIVN